MKRYLINCVVLISGLHFLRAAEPDPAGPVQLFDLVDGDRVLFLGDALMERERSLGYVETLMTVQYPDRKVIFRNLGWGADLPNGRSRASFDWNQPPDVWFRKLTNQVAVVDPTVVLMGYGMAASFDGPAGVESFQRDLGRLMDAIKANARHDVRFVLLSPIARQNLGGPIPANESHEHDLKEYVGAVQSVALAKGARYVNLYHPTVPAAAAAVKPGYTETINGIHLSPEGYLLMASKLASDFGWPLNSARFGVNPGGVVRDGTYGANLTGAERQGREARFKVVLDRLPPAILSVTNDGTRAVGPERMRVQIPRLTGEGVFVLVVDGAIVQEGTPETWTDSREVARGADFDQAEKLRELIVRKNNLFLNRWRPQNDTYLFGFRKHEQGRNAAEVPQFDAAVAALDEAIQQLKRPVSHVFEIRPKILRDRFIEAMAPDRTRKLTDNTGSLRTEDYSKSPIPFEVADGFEVTLFAQQPLLAKPVQMTWGNDSELYVATSQSYPQLQPGQPADDKIIGIRDSDGDGTADISHVVADGLQIPTGLAYGDRGLYVAHGTELLFLKDINNDGYMDQRRPVLSAFGTEDTHHLLHSLQWGVDGQLYMNQSIYIHSHVETPQGIRRLNSGGVWAFRPQTHELEVYLKGFCNPWGHIFDEYGQSFVTDGAGFQGVSWGLPGAMYFTYAAAPRILDSISPGAYPKFSGLEVVQTPNFPADWQGDLITCDFRAHRVVRFKLQEDGAGYVTREMPDLIRTTDVSFRPIDVKLGPDGALYIADWSNPIIQHGEVDFRDARRDKTSGRIWRVTRKGGPVEFAPNYQYLPTPQLLERVHSPNGQIRRAVARSLAERPLEMVQVLPEWTKNQVTELQKLRALWLYQAIDRVNPPLLKQLLAAGDHRVRAAATRVLGAWAPFLDGGPDLLAERSRDEHPRVRVEAIRGLARTPSAATAELILAASDRPMDKFVEYAAWLGINDAADAWVAAIESGQWKPAGREKQLAFGLKSIPADKAARVLAKLLPQKLAADGSGGWLEVIGAAGTTAELTRVYEQALAGGFQPATLARAFDALNDAGRNRNLRPTGDLGRVASFFAATSADVRAAALRLSGAWKESKDGFAALVKVAAGKQTPAAERQLAFQAIRESGGGGAIAALVPLCDAAQPLVVRQGAVSVLATLDSAKAAPLSIDVLNQTTNETAALDLWRSLLTSRSAGKPLATAAAASKLTALASATGLRATREGGRNEPELLQALTLASNSAAPVGELSDAAIQKLAVDARAKGDPHLGELIYRRTELACAPCHSIGGVGGKVGPDLTSIGASAPADYLVESLVYPNRKIKEGYHSVVIETKDGQEFSGVLTRQSETQLFIRNAADQEIAVAKNNIARQNTGASLMPAGLLESLPAADQLHLVRFLTELGKPGDFDASRGGVARRWRLRQGTHRDEQFETAGGISGLLKEGGWASVATLVDGRLPAASLQEALRTDNANNANSMVALWAHARFRVTQAGPVKFKIVGGDGAQIWIGGKAVQAGAEVSVELPPAGTHDLLIKLQPKTLPDQIKVSSDGVTFLVD